MNIAYKPSSYIRPVDVRIQFGDFDFCHPNQKQYSVWIDDPDFRDGRGKPFSLLIRETDGGESSWLIEPWYKWLPEAVSFYIQHTLVSSDLPIAKAWLAAWEGSADMDDSMETLYAMAYARKVLPSLEKQAQQLAERIERLKRMADSEQELQIMEAARI